MNGRVYLIGAGPGDPELMTLKAVRALGAADVVLLDDLVDAGCLAYARPGARVVRVGKRGGCKSTPQAFIESLLVQNAKQGKTVARLKGGDPLVFGRGGEELEALRAAGVRAEVIPGITAGIGAPATLGIPVTHRGMARAVTFVTGHAEADWRALVRSRATLVIYMGLRQLPQIVAALLRDGMAPHMPACVIENATLRSQREIVAPLRRLALAAAALKSPAIVVVGDVVAFAAVRSQEKQRAA